MTAPITLDSIPEIKRGHRLQWEETQDCYVILFPEGMVQLSASAGEIMKHIDGNRAVTGIIDILTEQFPGADLHGDIVEFLTEAKDNGWIHLK